MIVRKKNQKQIFLVLASQSKGRKQILENLGINFKIDPANIDEDNHDIKNPEELVKFLSLEKAKLIAAKYHDSLIIAADTIVLKDGEIIGKPKDESHAKEMLNKLNGTTHEVYTGLALYDTTTQKHAVDLDCSLVEFYKLNDEKIESYLKSREWIGKAGSYSSQEQGGQMLIKKISGDPSNVVGLPINLFKKMLNELDLEIK